MSETLEDDGRRLIDALPTIHGKQFTEARLVVMADELTARRFEQSDASTFDARMNRCVTRLGPAVHRNVDHDVRHTLETPAIMDMTPSIAATVGTQATDDVGLGLSQTFWR